MGVPQFFKWVEKKSKNKQLIQHNLNTNIDYLMIDANCLLHPCINHMINEYKKGNLSNVNSSICMEQHIWNKIEEYINDLIERVKPNYLFIAVDGVAPMGKIIQQRQRRYKNSNMDINEICPLPSIDLTPGTLYMKRLDEQIINYCKKLNIKYKYSSCFEENEGEHKIFQLIRNEIDINKNIVIYGLDADLLFLSLTDNLKHNLFVMREKQHFNNDKTSEDNLMNNISNITYNYININEFHKIINNLKINFNDFNKIKTNDTIKTDDFVILCFFLGNDFMPSLLSLNIKNYGIEQLMEAYLKVIHNKKMSLLQNGNINFVFIFELLNNLKSTEYKVFEKNTLFNNSNEYYKHYINKNIDIEKQKKRMVYKYIQTIEWCYKYYYDKCYSWKHYYDYNIPPLITDIIKYYPEKVLVIRDERILRPIEQLILVIPLNFYEHVFGKKVYDKIVNNVNFLKIKYLFPIQFEIDIYKEKIEWKQNIMIPFIDYEYYIRIIKKIKI